VLIIINIPVVNLRQGKVRFYLTSSRFKTGLVCKIPPLSMLLLPTSVQLIKIVWNLKFTMVSYRSQNGHINYIEFALFRYGKELILRKL
jgi:hypothetical protein